MTTHARRDHVELIATLLLAVATVATAWSSTKLTTPRLRIAMLALGCTVFLVTAVWIVTSPISLAV